MSKIKISIAGGTGYTAGELLRILYQHPNAEVISVSSTSIAGKPFYTAHPDLEGLYSMNFDEEPNTNADVLFLCLGHGISKKFLDKLNLNQSLKIIDLSNDFRLAKDRNYNNKTFIYGLPELNKTSIKGANYLANPGCFATSIQLALLPLAKHGLILDDIHVSAITGSTGAGGKPSATTHFSWRNNNISSYKVFSHQHLDEITESLQQLDDSFNHPIRFIPMRGDFSRGIYSNVYTKTNLKFSKALKIYQDYYKNEPFICVSEGEISMKNVVNTNRCFLQVRVIDDQIIIHSVIDNLVKGASGQAIQNMNLMFGLPEETGLKLKPTLL